MFPGNPAGRCRVCYEAMRHQRWSDQPLETWQPRNAYRVEVVETRPLEVEFDLIVNNVPAGRLVLTHPEYDILRQNLGLNGEGETNAP